MRTRKSSESHALCRPQVRTIERLEGHCDVKIADRAENWGVGAAERRGLQILDQFLQSRDLGKQHN
jgi:hypothetical protein